MKAQCGGSSHTFTISLTSALDGVGWLTPRPCRNLSTDVNIYEVTVACNLEWKVTVTEMKWNKTISELIA